MRWLPTLRLAIATTRRSPVAAFSCGLCAGHVRTGTRERAGQTDSITLLLIACRCVCSFGVRLGFRPCRWSGAQLSPCGRTGHSPIRAATCVSRLIASLPSAADTRHRFEFVAKRSDLIPDVHVPCTHFKVGWFGPPGFKCARASAGRLHRARLKLPAWRVRNPAGFDLRMVDALGATCAPSGTYAKPSPPRGRPRCDASCQRW